MRRRPKLGWLNFLYGFFELEVLIKGFLGIGTLCTIVKETGMDFSESFFLLHNLISFFACILILVECVIKLLACIFSSKAEGYNLMVIALAVSFVAGIFFVYSDQGFGVGTAFLILSAGFHIANYLYVKKRKDVFGNPDLL